MIKRIVKLEIDPKKKDEFISFSKQLTSKL